MPRDISKRQSCSKQISVLVWITCNNSCLECGIIINFSILKLLDKLSLPVILWFSFERDSDNCLLNCDCRALNEGLSEDSTLRRPGEPGNTTVLFPAVRPGTDSAPYCSDCLSP